MDWYIAAYRYGSFGFSLWGYSVLLLGFKYQRHLPTVPLGTLPPYFEDCNESQSTTFYFNKNIKNVDIYIHLQQSRQYKTTAITNIQNNNGLPIHAHRYRSFAGESQRCCMYPIFLSKKQIMILIQLNSSHTLPNYLAHLPLPLSSRLSSHPIPFINPSILTHPVPRLSQFLLLGNPQKSRSTFWNQQD